MKFFALPFCMKASLTALILLPIFVLGADRVTGANATLDINAGAKSAALGGAALAINDDLTGLTSNPGQLATTQYSWLAFSHVAYYEGTQYDFAAMSLPLGEGHGVGLAFSRFGANDIPWIAEGEPVPEGSDYRTLNIADYTITLAWGKRFGRFDAGVAFHGLYRELDQSGFGFRGDASLRFYLLKQLSVAGLIKGWTSSAATWESGTFEYSSPEAYLATQFHQEVPYFYGGFYLYWQSAGLLHREARDLEWQDTPSGGRIWESPGDWFLGSRVGAEYRFDFGLSVRAGFSSLTKVQSFTAGAVVELASFLKVDYAFESHPTLSAVHRVSLSFSPWLFSHPPKKKIEIEWSKVNEKSTGVENKGPLLEEEPLPEEQEEDVGSHWEE